VCFRPLVNYDPHLFTPISSDSIDSRYEALMGCECHSIVDPSTQDVARLLGEIATRGHNERVIVHYFGQGCESPKTNRLFFFNAKRSTYQGLTLSTMFSRGFSPICLILDCASAGSLLPAITELGRDNPDRDVIAFMASREGELLPSEASVPIDILSSSILFPLESAFWLHGHRSRFCGCPSEIAEPFDGYLAAFLSAVLEAIAISRFPPALYEKFFGSEPSLGKITRGFILGSRILGMYNVHACSHPELPRTDDSDLWAYWDLALDTYLVQPDHIFDLVFAQLETSFTSFPGPYAVPLFAFFLDDPQRRGRILELLYGCLDSHPHLLSGLVNRNLVRALLPIQGSLLRSLIIARLLVDEPPLPQFVPEILQSLPLNDSPALDQSLLVYCCCAGGSFLPNTSDMLRICAENALRGAPYSMVLFGLLVQKSQAFMTHSSYFESFVPLLKDGREDVRAAAVFGLGFVRDPRAIAPLIDLIMDESDLVSSEAVIALALAIRIDLSKLGLPDGMIAQLRDGIGEKVGKSAIFAKNYDSVKEAIERFMARMEGRPEEPQAAVVRGLPAGRLIALLRQSIRSPGLIQRFDGNIFQIV
jgi:hypothetical protein